MYRYFTGDVVGSEPKQSPKYDTPLGVVTYRIPLEPRESRTLVFKMPVAPIPGDSAQAKQLIAADAVQHFGGTVSFLENLVGRRGAAAVPRSQGAGDPVGQHGVRSAGDRQDR